METRDGSRLKRFRGSKNFLESNKPQTHIPYRIGVSRWLAGRCCTNLAHLHSCSHVIHSSFIMEKIKLSISKEWATAKMGVWKAMVGKIYEMTEISNSSTLHTWGDVWWRLIIIWKALFLLCFQGWVCRCSCKIMMMGEGVWWLLNNMDQILPILNMLWCFITFLTTFLTGFQNIHLLYDILMIFLISAQLLVSQLHIYIPDENPNQTEMRKHAYEVT